MKKKRLVSGMRPTGKLHWGNYFGALKNWTELQEKFDCFFFIADWHALTTAYEDVSEIQSNVKEVLKDWLAVGIDPQKSTLFLQSFVTAHAELHLILSMITPLSWLQRVPSYKDMKLQMEGKDLDTYGFLGYPVLQTADVALYGAACVPVGEDQLAHIELSREIIRRFHFVLKAENIFVEPEALLTKTPRVPGIDGRKMSKSFGNAIYIADDEAEISKKMMATITDPARQRRTDPGDPDKCRLYDYHRLFTPDKERSEVDADCRSAKIGCVDCKKKCIANALKFWNPIREERKKWDGKEAELLQMLQEGSKQASESARATLEKVKEKVGLHYS